MISIYKNLSRQRGQKTNPIQTQFKPNLTQNKPNSKPIKPKTNPISLGKKCWNVFALFWRKSHNIILWTVKSGTFTDKEKIR